MEAFKYTCLKCQVEFSSRELVNSHYSGKWHQYNLLKIQRGLLPCTENEYNELMAKTTFLQEVRFNLICVV